MPATTTPAAPPRHASNRSAASSVSSPAALIALGALLCLAATLAACAGTAPAPGSAMLLAQRCPGDAPDCPEAWPAAPTHGARPQILALVPVDAPRGLAPGLASARAAVDDATRLAERLARPASDGAQPPGRAQKKLAARRQTPVGHLRIVAAPGAEPVELQVYDEAGLLQLDALRHFAELLGASDVSAVEPRLLAMLYIVGRDFDRPVHLVSGHRDAEAATGFACGHADGRAVDLYLPDVSTTALRDYLRATFAQVGVGDRPRAGHVHLDVRTSTLHWTDLARPGQTGREQLAPVAAVPQDDPTLDALHLPVAALYPVDKPPRDSKRTEPPETDSDRNKKKRAGKGKKGRKYHSVRAGETVSGIAKKYGTSADKLIEWNKLGKDAVIRPGQKLRVRR